MEAVTKAIETAPGGLALDVASGPGSFAKALETFSKSFTGVIAIDSLHAPLKAMLANPAMKGIQPVAMDACRMAFQDCTFSTAAISNSLHHMEDPSLALGEMLRVLTPGGMLMVREMFAGGGQTAAQKTHTLMHNWWGRVDASNGIVHRPVFTKFELKQLLKASGAASVRFQDVEDLTGNPFDEEVISRIETAFNAYMKRTALFELEEQGEKAMAHMRKHGFTGARALLAYGYKPVQKPASGRFSGTQWGLRSRSGESLSERSSDHGSMKNSPSSS
jgi:ubiquinone/menaquinone biosynthesis C-methylase UbiE